jgi:hypothetical protein
VRARARERKGERERENESDGRARSEGDAPYKAQPLGPPHIQVGQRVLVVVCDRWSACQPGNRVNAVGGACMGHGGSMEGRSERGDDGVRVMSSYKCEREMWGKDER